MLQGDALQTQERMGYLPVDVYKVFRDLIGNTMEVYVDNMLVKSEQRTDHLQHLDKAFYLLK